ncbi:RICIN domain-containing protein [Streptomyces sp. NBC_00057]|uniref:RICIN domain-containing protein n=1 Tax=Streptomyces sp. NBC_00057 TaxID=2975634 RepID=UPI00386427C3
MASPPRLRSRAPSLGRRCRPPIRTSGCGDGSVYPGFGTCSSSDAYTWTFRSSGGDTFKLVNRASGYCLSAPNNNDYRALLGACNGYGGTGNVHWRIGSTTAAGQTLKNTETGHCLEIASTSFGSEQVMVTTCNSDQPQQLWTRG